MLSNEYEEINICFVKFLSRSHFSLGCTQGTEFYYAAFNSSGGIGKLTFTFCGILLYFGHYNLNIISLFISQ